MNGSQNTPSPPPDISPASDFLRIDWPMLWKGLVIIAAACWVYAPTLHATWYGDDPLYLTENPLLKDPTRLWKAWFEPGSFIEYYPLTQSVQWYQWLAWGTSDTFGYHVSNLVLHILSALLFWRLLNKFGLRLAWVGGFLFAIHPVMVDSIGTACELKNTLSLPPFLLAMALYFDFEETRQPHAYLLTLTMFAVAMLCKITMMFFPIMILIYAWWKRDRVTLNDLKISAPFFVLTLVLVAINLQTSIWYAQGTHYVQPGPTPLGGLESRAALTGLSLAFYFGHCFLAWPIMPFYLQWPIDPPSLLQFAPWFGVFLVIGWCWRQREGWGRHALLGLSFFTLGLAPFLGVYKVTYMCLTWFQDHFLYLPIIGLIAIVVAGLEQAGEQLPRKVYPPGVAVTTLAAALLAFQTHSYAKLFADPEELWAYNLQFNPNSWMARYHYGINLISVGQLNKERLEQGIEQLQESTALNPDFFSSQFILGLALNDDSRPVEAIGPLQEAVRIKPDYDMSRFVLGVNLEKAQRFPEAVEQFEALLKLNPHSDQAHTCLGVTLAHMGRNAEAVEQFQIALQINPENAQARNFLAQWQNQQTRATQKPVTP